MQDIRDFSAYFSSDVNKINFRNVMYIYDYCKIFSTSIFCNKNYSIYMSLESDTKREEKSVTFIEIVIRTAAINFESFKYIFQLRTSIPKIFP